VPFLALTFGLAWAILGLFIIFADRVSGLLGELSAHHPLFVLAVYAPAIAGILVVFWHGGASGLRRYLSRLLLWRCSGGWYVYIVVGIPLVYFAAAFVKGGVPDTLWVSEGVAPLLAAMLFMLFLGPVEELGWRGVALPLLQRRFTPFSAGLILGAVWGLWHWPAFLLSGTPQAAWEFAPFLVGSIAVSLILTPLFNQSRGSILLAAIYHFQLINPAWPDAQPYDMLFFTAVALVVTWIQRDRMFQLGGVTSVIPVRSRTGRWAGGDARPRA
jgi:membrane protease YdiL (CAAX protease family)